MQRKIDPAFLGSQHGSQGDFSIGFAEAAEAATAALVGDKRGALELFPNDLGTLGPVCSRLSAQEPCPRRIGFNRPQHERGAAHRAAESRVAWHQGVLQEGCYLLPNISQNAEPLAHLSIPPYGVFVGSAR